MGEAREGVAENLFVGGGEMGALMRSLDWSQTPLGTVAHWSSSLRTSLSICLMSRFPILIWWGPELVMLYNDAYRPILGSTKHPQALGQRGQECWSEIWHVIGPMLEGVLATRQATWSDNQLLLINRNGYVEECYFTFSYSPIQDETGQVGGVFTAVTETTEQVLSERRLQTLRDLARSTAEVKTVTEACRLAIATLANNPYDVPFALLYWVEANGKQARLVQTAGIASGTAASPPQIDLTQAADVWNLTQVKATAEAQRLEDLPSRFGESLPLGIWSEAPSTALVMPIAQAGHKEQLTGLLVLGISPRRKFDDEYRGFFDLIASNVATAIAETQAYEAERQRAEALAELDRAKTAFFSNVSHEFRTPLTLMLSPLEDMICNLNGSLLPQEHEQLQLVLRNGRRLLKLVNSLLDFSRIEAGRVRAVYEPVDLATYTTELASTFRSLVERAGMALIVDCPPLPEAVYVDREMWEKIVLNLISNAFKFTLAGTITIRLRWLGSQVELSVADTGVGIPSSELPRLFERFHRVENAQGRSFEGSGIGLSLVQELVKLQGGVVAVSSNLGQGSCFTVTIPTGTAHLPQECIHAQRTLASTGLGAMPYVEEAQRWLPEADRAPGGMIGGGMIGEESPSAFTASLHHFDTPLPRSTRILLADDNADMRDYIRRLLSSAYTVETVADGITALTAIQNHPPDLVLTDVMMPGIDGVELLHSLRSHPQTQAVPVILLSARAGEEARLEGLAAGADDYVIKPFSARELLVRVEATLKLSKLRREALQQEQTLRAESITAQQKAETALRRMVRLLESMSEAFIALDHGWQIIYQNAAAERINKRPRSEVVGKTLWEGWPAAVGSTSEQQYRRALTEQVAVHFEQHYYEPPEQDVWLEVHAYPFEEGLGIFYRDISEAKRDEVVRQQAEIALRQSEERYRTLFESIDQSFCLCEMLFDENGEPIDYRILEVNPVFESMTGLQDVVGKTARELVPDLEADWFEIYGRVVRTGESVRFENQAAAMNQWFDVNAFRVGEPQNHQFALLFTNISERKRAEAFLQRSAEMDAFRVSLNDALRLLADPIEIQATASRVLGEYLGANRVTYFEVCSDDYVVERDYVNGAVALAGRYPIASFGSTLIAEYCAGRTVVVSNVADDPSLSSEQKFAYASIQIAAHIGIPLIKQDKFVAGLAIHAVEPRLWTPEEVTLAEEVAERTWAAVERARAEAALRDSEELKQRILESSKDCIAVLTLNSEIIYISTGGLRLLEIADPTLVLNACWLDFWQGDDYENAKIAIAAAKAGNTGQFQGFLSTRKGTPKWWDSIITPVRNTAGQVTQLVAISRDITKQKQAETERERLLVQEQIAREAADRANHVKDEFLAVLSHELRSPLNPILGWSKLLQQGKLDAAKTATALATIERNAQLQVQLIDDLLDISRILRGKLSLTVTSVDLNRVITEALETVRLAAEAKAIQIQVLTSSDVGVVIGDAGRLQQVVWNLLSNAVKFTPHRGQITVTLSSDQSHAQIQVSDTGKGIRADFLPYVFEHFRQEDGATTRKFGGLGLGLAIVQQIVELHGGTVAVDSPGEDQGATFTVGIPLAPRSHISPAIEQPSSSTGDLSGTHILVADDDDDSREFVTFVLEHAGAIVTTAASGVEALQAFAQSIPNLIVSDIGMPDMDGYMLLRQIRSLPLEQGGRIPAIALTAYAGELDQQQAITAGFQRHIAKPIDPEVVIATAVELVS